MSDKLASTPVYIDRAEFTGRSFDVLAHRHDQILIVELEERREPSSLSWFDLYSGLSAAVSKLEATVTLQSFLNLAAQEIRSFSGFDRVMIYNSWKTRVAGFDPKRSPKGWSPTWVSIIRPPTFRSPPAASFR